MKYFSAHLPLRTTTQYHHKLTARQEDQRIKIQLHHTGLVSRAPLIGQRRKEVEEFLTEVWSQFGPVSKTYYDRDFTSVIVTYKMREHAFFALASLRDSIEVTVAIQTAIQADLERAALAKQIFVCQTPGGNLLSASFVGSSQNAMKNNRFNQ